MHSLHDMKFCHKFGSDLLPEYSSSKMFFRYPKFQQRTTRQSGNLPLPAVSHDFAFRKEQYVFRTSSRKPLSIKIKTDTHSFNGFKNFIKLKYLVSYPTACNIVDYYSCTVF